MSHFLNTVVDKVFVLNLKRRPDRLALFRKQAENIGLTNYEVFEALDAKALGLSHKDSLIHPGMVGCYDSHVKIMQKCIDEGIESYLVFEDDALFIDGFNFYLDIAWPHIPTDWEFLYLGYTEHHGFNTHLKQINEFVVIPQSVWGTQGFMVRGTDAIKRLLKGLETMIMQIDCQLSQVVLRGKKIKHYCVFPSIVNQQDGRDTDVQVHNMKLP